MRKTFITVILYCFIFQIKAQSPQAIPYQAIVRNASGIIISNQLVKLRFSIHDSLATGAVVYKEIHTIATNAQGLVNVNIGQGAVQTGTFSAINWGKNGKFIQTELDALNNNTYTDLGTTQMMSVPYALYANNGIKNGNIKGQMMYWNDTSWVSLSPGTQGQLLTFCDGLPHWGDCPNSTTMTYCNKVWSTVNLNVTKYRNGDIIPQVTNPTDWSNLTTGAWCWYNNDSLLGIKYGRIYNWYAINDPRGLAPSGWHIPSITEWQNLYDCLTDYRSMFDVNYWIEDGNILSQAVNNFSKFSARPGGMRNAYINSPNQDFENATLISIWWSSTPDTVNVDCIRGNLLADYAFYMNTIPKKMGAYIRCIKD